MIDQLKNIVYDTNYTSLISQGWFVIDTKTVQHHVANIAVTPTDIVQTTDIAISPAISLPEPHIQEPIPAVQTTTPAKSQKPSFFTNLFGGLFGTTKKQAAKNTAKVEENPQIVNKELKDQVKYLLELPDAEYNDKKITQQLRKFIADTDKHHTAAVADYKTHIAPSFRKVDGGMYQLSGLYGKSYYMQTYPSYLEALWTRDVFSFHGKWDMSFFIYPEDDSAMQSMLKQKATQLKSEMNDAASKGITIDTEIELQFRDIDEIRQKLATREERYYETWYYTTLYEEEKEKLSETTKKFEQKIAWLGMRVKASVQRMDEWFMSSLPLCIDQLGITRSTITSSLWGSFPFISQDMLANTGILYGVNQHTWGLVVFDRFNSNLPNMNSVVLATSGAGKSFTVKLEILRYLLNNIDVIVIDPENEYKWIVDKVGGSYINISTGSTQFINPFDIPPKIEDRDYSKWDLLRGQIMGMIGLINILVGGLTPEQEAMLDKALQTTYQLKWITLEDDDYTGKIPPLMSDLYNVLQSTTGAENLAVRLSKYVTWSFAKIFNNYTNVDINSNLTVFSIRDLEDALKTPAMYSVLNFIWTKVRSQKKKRMLVCDEAWIMLQNEVSAEFLFGLIKRARKYGLGITTISQDIEDFMRSKYGKPIVSNSALQILLKQSTSSVKTLEQIIGLSEAEKQRLVACSIGEGLLFAGNQHVALKILASPQEKEFITTDVKQ
jgi:conjugal transfer ATP-binding protein TraC